jgi:predicted nuclease of predicted toxin-antitoxin system
MNVLVDMNLSPALCDVLARHGHDALHWSSVGNPRASDAEIMTWARAHGCVVLTHDLDFGTLLALTKARGPSVIQVRTQDVTPQHLELLLIPLLKDVQQTLEAGALVTVDEGRSRIRVLPLHGRK